VGQGRAGQGWAGQGRVGQGRAGQGRAGQGRAGQGRAGPALDSLPIVSPSEVSHLQDIDGLSIHLDWGVSLMPLQTVQLFRMVTGR
jgi:hypothetical protein